MTRFYHNAAWEVTECHKCGEVRLCEILVADSPERETGYVDEYAFCEECGAKGSAA